LLSTHFAATTTGGDSVRRKQPIGELSAPARQDQSSLEQARTVAVLLPSLMRQMFIFDKDPVNDLPLTQLRVCGLLYEQPRSMSALSRELGISLSAMTQLADRLERVRLVERQANSSDRRVRQLRLTGRGEQMMGNHREGRIRCVSTVFQYLSPASREQVLDALQTLMRACTASRGAKTPSSPIHEQYSTFPTLKANP
jgi:DNA-binding MarR family transcriptional regulator